MQSVHAWRSSLFGRCYLTVVRELLVVLDRLKEESLASRMLMTGLIEWADKVLTILFGCDQELWQKGSRSLGEGEI